MCRTRHLTCSKMRPSSVWERAERRWNGQRKEAVGAGLLVPSPRRVRLNRSMVPQPNRQEAAQSEPAGQREGAVAMGRLARLPRSLFRYPNLGLVRRALGK